MSVCFAFTLVTLLLSGNAERVLAPMPGFIPTYQTALVTVYAVTTYLLFAQFRRTRSLSLLVLAAGSLFTTLVVFVQFLTFPNILGPGRLLGQGPETTAWLWVFWHVGPPLFALPYAVLDGDGSRYLRPSGARRVGWVGIGLTVAIAAAVAFLTCAFPRILPISAIGDDYRPLMANGIAQSVVALTLLALGAVVWTTRLQTVLQLWLAVSLYLLVLDNLITIAGGTRGSIGWVSGRLEALIAAVILLGVYLREVDFLYGRAEQAAKDSDRQHADLRLARDRLALALDAAGMADWELNIADDSGRRSLEHDRIFGYETLQPRWGLREFLAHVVVEDRPLVEAAVARALRSGGLDLECRITRLGETRPRWVMIRGEAHFDQAGQATEMAGVIMDTTERRTLEERSNQAQKMAALGQLTGGVAHDFNNLLTVIIGNFDMIIRTPSNTARVQKLAHSGMTAARRGVDVIQNLLSFSRQQILHPETVNPNRILKGFLPLLKQAVGEACTIETDFDASLDPVRLDPGQFENAVLNLVVNARDAMPAGGLLRLKTANALLAEADLDGMPELEPGNYVIVSVRDTGTGMDATTKARALDPFYTTKDVGKGTGLGLSQAYGFVRQAGGHIRIISEVGDGTRIDLVFPRSDERAATARASRTTALRRARDGEVVLVVEDEPAVRAMAIESLEDLGYDTLVANDAIMALDTLRGSDRIDILFSDVVMPGGMNGVQLAVEARRVRPDLRVLLTSGYTAGRVDNHDMPVLSKPYLREDLAVQLRVVMDA